jgi:tetratricopeptide (TPR) repeat protein
MSVQLPKNSSPTHALPAHPARRSRAGLIASLLGGAVTILAGCATPGGPAATSTAGAPAKPVQAAATKPAEAARTELPDNELTGPILGRMMLGEVLAQRGNPAFAHDVYIQLARDTRDPRIARRATEFALSAGRLEGALAASQLWVSLAPNDLEARQTAWTLLAGSNQRDILEPLLAADIASNPNRAEAIGNAQRIVARLPDRNEGHAMLTRLLAPLGEQADALLALAISSFGVKQPDAALTYSRRALAARPAFERAALVQAQLLQDKPAEAIKLLEDFTRRNPAAREARMSLARLYATNKQSARARELFTALAAPVTQGGERDQEAVYALGLMNLQDNKLDEAEALFTEYLTLIDDDEGRDPTNAYLNLGAIAEDRRRFEEALDWYGRVERPDARFTAQMRSALAEAKLNRVDRAKSRLEALAKSTPNERRRIAMAEGQILRDAGRTGEAEAVLRAALTASPDAHDIKYDLALTLERLGRHDEMEALLREVIAAEPKNAHAYNALGYSLAERNERLDEAEVLLTQALALTPDDAYIVDSMGWLQFRQGKLKEAIATLRRAWSLKQDAEIATHLGEVLWVAGQKDEARKFWQEARKLNPANETLASTLTRFQIQLP